MDVRDNGDAHGRTVAKGLALAAAVLVWVVAAVFLWRTEVPALSLPDLDAGDYFGAGLLDRIEDYRRGSRLLFLLSLAAEIAVLAVAVWQARPLADRLQRIGRGRVRTSVLVGLAVVAAGWLATLPFGAVSLVRRRDAGLSEQSWAGWLTDRLTALGLRAVLVSIAVAGAVWLAGRFGRRWWLVGAPALAAVGVVFILVQPLVVQPLFNRFEPLEDRELAADIEALAAGMGVEVDDVLVADASRRTTTANAYIAGLGPTRRVVLYDTLLDGRFSEGEIRFVSAHELAHVERRHLWKGLAWFTLLAVPGVFGLAWLTNRYGGLGPRLVPLGLAFAFAYLLVTQPVSSAVSRRYEAEADWLALQATRDPESGIALDRNFVRTGLADPDPPAWVRIVYGTHPTPLQRIAMAEAWPGEPSVTVPQVVPTYADDAVAALGAAGLEPSMDDVPEITRADGSVNGYAVRGQDPMAGVAVPRGSTVRLELVLSVNAGPGGLGEEGVVSVPDLVGLGINQAIARATAGGLYATVIPPRGQVRDLVVRGQSLTPGDRVQAGAEIRLSIA